ncbi:MAG: hypothetical protein J3K34DRAFT_516537 [Monoraphidium minutum]|nr:MAG: hypothetical protein J3K34DRAFT_516537 [Monoraphidium minutum]
MPRAAASRAAASRPPPAAALLLALALALAAAPPARTARPEPGADDPPIGGASEPAPREGAGAAAAGAAAAAAGGALLPIDLAEGNFTGAFTALPPEGPVLVEFYASWCPHCRAFRPEYEKIAAFCARETDIKVFRVDCAAEPVVCAKFAVLGYPTMLAGRAADVAAENATRLQSFEARRGKGGRDAAGVVQWLGEAFGRPLNYTAAPDEGGAEGEGQPPAGHEAAGAQPQDGAIWRELDVAGATWMLFDQVAASRKIGSDARAAALGLLELFSDSHPVSRRVPPCSDAAAEAVEAFDDLWPPGAPAAAGDLRPLNPCPVRGDAGLLPEGGAASVSGALRGVSALLPRLAGHLSGEPPWGACRGSVPYSRGYTCGLWLLFHTIAARVAEEDGGRQMMAALRGFATHYFMCSVCQEHFLEMLARPEAQAVTTRRDVAMWLWRAHNEVNARLALAERENGHSTSGDPRAPKRPFPPPAACAACRRAGGAPPAAGGNDFGAAEWDDDRVAEFLQRAYGGDPPDAGASAPGPRPPRPGAAGRDAAYAALAAASVLLAVASARRAGAPHSPNKVL